MGRMESEGLQKGPLDMQNVRGSWEGREAGSASHIPEVMEAAVGFHALEWHNPLLGLPRFYSWAGAALDRLLQDKN